MTAPADSLRPHIKAGVREAAMPPPVQSPGLVGRGSVVRPPSVQRMGSAVVLQGTALLEVRALLALGVRERDRRDAVPPSQGIRLVLALLTEALAEAELLSPPRQRDACSADGLRQSDVDQYVDWSDLQGQRRRIGSREAAVMLRNSQRTVQRAASSLGGRRGPDGRLSFDADVVLEYAADRDARRASHG